MIRLMYASSGTSTISQRVLSLRCPRLRLQSLAVLEAAYGAADVRFAAALHNVAGIYVAQHDYPTARPYYERALKVRDLQMSFMECPNSWVSTLQAELASLRTAVRRLHDEKPACNCQRR